MLQKKIKKYIVFALVVIFTFVIFIIPASAVEFISIPFDGGLTLENFGVILMDEYGQVYEDLSLAVSEAGTGLPDTVSLSVWMNAGALDTAHTYTLRLSFNSADYLVSTDNYCVGSFDVRLYAHQFNFVDYFGYPLFSRFGNGPTQLASCTNTFETLNGSNFSTCHVDFTKNEVGTSYTDYVGNLSFNVLTPVQGFRVFISNVDFQLINPVDAAVDEITEGWDGPELDFDKDASDIGAVEEDALNENYKLLVGYDIDTGEPIYSEGTLQDMGKATITSVGDTVTSFLSAPQSLMAFTELFSRILYVPKLSLVVYLALALGILPLIYGLSINTSTSFIHRFTNRKE